MTTDNDVIRQLTELKNKIERESEKREEINIRLKKAEIFIAYMRNSATKWGSALMGALALGTIIVMGVDKVKDKIVNWFFP